MRDSNKFARNHAVEVLKANKYVPQALPEKVSWFIASQQWDKLADLGRQALSEIIKGFEVKDWEKALSLALEILNTENVLENCLVGRRLYLEEEDWNYVIVYPIAFDGMFYPY